MAAESNLVPSSWVYSTLGDVSLPPQYGYTAKSQLSGQVKYVRTTDITKGVINWNSVPYCQIDVANEENYSLRDGDILVSRAGSVGMNIRISRPERAVFASYLIRFVPLINSQYFAYFLRSDEYKNAIREASSGIAMQNVNATKLAKIKIPVAPAAEQERIVRKLDESLSQLELGLAQVGTALQELSHYRQSLFKAAIEGELTAEWRKRSQSTAHGKDLLSRILVQRRQEWEETELRRYNEKGKRPPAEWRKKYREPFQPDTSALPRLPSSWVWASVEQLGKVQLGRQRSPDKLSKLYPTKYIRAANITESGLSLEDVYEMDFDPSERQKYALKEGDVLLAEASGSPEQVGRAALWINTAELYCFQNTVIRFSPLVIRPAFALTVFQGWQKLGTFGRLAGGVGINHLSLGKFSKMPMPLPPLAEQDKIAAEVQEKRSEAMGRERDLALLKTQVDKQRSAILTSAFTGRLLPQDPNDEPAIELLHKIASQKSKNKLAASTRRKPILQKKSKIMKKTLIEILSAQALWIPAQDAFRECGIVDGVDSDRVEEVYLELGQLLKTNKVEVRRIKGSDEIRLLRSEP